MALRTEKTTHEQGRSRECQGRRERAYVQRPANQQRTSDETEFLGFDLAKGVAANLARGVVVYSMSCV
ncbi:hypothetical protein Dimus_032286 [Dionaea muscipula]